MTRQRPRFSRLAGAGWVFTVCLCAGLLVYFHWLHPRISMGHEQPIAFSHRLHVSDKQIDCAYCHPFAHRSLNAGLPSVHKCLGCHDHIIAGHPQIQRLKSARQSQQALAWLRVFYNPDHVFFPHYRHLGKGVTCQQCHGSVESQDRLQTHTFYMGFCIDCHQTRGASRECTACHQ